MDRVLGHVCFWMNDSRGRLDCAQMQNYASVFSQQSRPLQILLLLLFSILTGVTKLSAHDGSRHTTWVRK